MKYKVGDKVEVVSNENYNEFSIGEVVTITHVGKKDYDYIAQNDSGDWWYMTDKELKIVK